jgi:hypothetical protein
MRQVYSINLLTKLHLAKFIYHNPDHTEIYAWFGSHTIKIFDYLGEETGNSSILNSETNKDYNITDDVNEKDVQNAIDCIVRLTYCNDV